MAWLNAIPNDAKGKRADKSRLQARRERGDAIPLPEVAFTYLTDWLFEIGPVVSGGMGDGPVGYRDIAAWQDITGVIVQPWEARTIRRLSQAYLAGLRKAEAHDCPMPYVGAADVADARESIDNKIRAAFGSLKRAG